MTTVPSTPLEAPIHVVETFRRGTNLETKIEFKNSALVERDDREKNKFVFLYGDIWGDENVTFDSYDKLNNKRGIFIMTPEAVAAMYHDRALLIEKLAASATRVVSEWNDVYGGQERLALQESRKNNTEEHLFNAHAVRPDPSVQVCLQVSTWHFVMNNLKGSKNDHIDVQDLMVNMKYYSEAYSTPEHPSMYRTGGLSLKYTYFQDLLASAAMGRIVSKVEAYLAKKGAN